MRSRHDFFFFAPNLVLTGPLDDIAGKAGQTTQAVFFDERFCGSATLREFRLVYDLWSQHTRQLEEEANFSIMDVKLEDVEEPFFTGIEVIRTQRNLDFKTDREACYINAPDLGIAGNVLKIRANFWRGLLTRFYLLAENLLVYAILRAFRMSSLWFGDFRA